MANIDNVTNNLLYSINQRQIYTGKATNFNDRISELQAEIATLEGKTGKSTGNITTEKSGCFLSHCDGYENALDYNSLDRLTLSDLDNVKQTKVSGNIAGKVVTGLKWYVACKVTADEATRLSLWTVPLRCCSLTHRLKAFPPLSREFIRNQKTATPFLFLSVTI